MAKARRKNIAGGWIVCPVCEGEGKTVNPAIDSNGLTAEDFREDPDLHDSYFRGDYDIVCRGCDGNRVVKPGRMEELRNNAEDRRLAAAEDGDWRTYYGAGDYRWG